MKVEERFLKYVSYWTTSCDGQEQIPSTDRQFELGCRREEVVSLCAFLSWIQSIFDDNYYCNTIMKPI